LTNAANRMKQWEDHSRRDVEFQVGELVLLKLSRDQFPPPKGMAPSLVGMYEEPFNVLKKIGNVTYRLELSFHMQHTHPVFHINQLKSCQRDLNDPSRFEPFGASSMVTNKPKFEIEKILAHRILGRGRDQVHKYFFHWKDKFDEEDSWERYESFMRT
jgi:hypothetical protein